MPNLSESQVIKIWQRQLLDKTELVTEEGEPIEIIYPGRINDDHGGDFRGAVLATRLGLIKGDIELHVRSSGWQEHQHHRDVAYNRVILHVVMWHDSKVATSLQNGKEVPILALHKYVPVSQLPDPIGSPSTLNTPCLKIGRRLTTSTVATVLDRAGEERFLAQAAGLQTELKRMGASQSLYRGIMGALGYSKNKSPMLELARNLPLHVLESVTQDRQSDEECLARQQALLLGSAGLLPSQRQDRQYEDGLNDPWMDKLESLWASVHHVEAMPQTAWHLFKVRPNNSPVRRLVAMSYLILRHQQPGVLEALVNMVREAPSDKGHRRLEEGLRVTTNGCQVSHLDFGSGSRIRNPTLLGSGRAADIAVNVLLPFTVAWSRFISQPELERKALDLYRSYPRLLANTVERHMMRQLGLIKSLVNSARRQQGLLHIYKSLCTQGRCHGCCLGQLEAGHNI